jgi:hypothetical protein
LARSISEIVDGRTLCVRKNSIIHQ